MSQRPERGERRIVELIEAHGLLRSCPPTTRSRAILDHQKPREARTKRMDNGHMGTRARTGDIVPEEVLVHGLSIMIS